MPLQSSRTSTGSEESRTAPSDKHKRAIMSRLTTYLAQTVGFSDNSRRIATIGYDTDFIGPNKITACFAGVDEHITAIDPPELASSDLSNVVLLKAKAAQSEHVSAINGHIRVKIGCGEWPMSASGRMYANLTFTDKHCWNKKIHTVEKITDNVEFWVLDHGAETLPGDMFVTREFTVKHGFDGSVDRPLAISHRKGLYRRLPKTSRGPEVAAAVAEQRAIAADDAAYQTQQERKRFGRDSA